MEPALRPDSNAGRLLPFCAWALRMENDKYTVPVGALVALPFRLVTSSNPIDQIWPHTLSSVCPPQGQRVFPGRRGQNPVGVSVLFQRKLPNWDCPANASLALDAGFSRLWAFSYTVLGENCRNSAGRLVFNTTLLRNAAVGDCWQMVMQLTDGARRQVTFKFV
jgi:hypothetical protein